LAVSLLIGGIEINSGLVLYSSAYMNQIL